MSFYHVLVDFGEHRNNLDYIFRIHHIQGNSDSIRWHCNDESRDKCVHGYQALCLHVRAVKKYRRKKKQKLIQIPHKIM